MGNGFRWLTALAIAFAVAVAGMYAYNLGLAHRFFPFFPLLFILFWILVLRARFPPEID